MENKGDPRGGANNNSKMIEEQVVVTQIYPIITIH